MMLLSLSPRVYFRPYLKGFRFQWKPESRDVDWAAVQELKSSYRRSETIFFTIVI